MKIAVIENEYGAVSIDTALVEENVREVSAHASKPVGASAAAVNESLDQRGCACLIHHH